jgi:aryl-alcohol dehydrogenase-like predicted oxidoreductase
MKSRGLGAKVALGTAQFGVPYGIANAHGQVRQQDVTRILYAARARGVDTLDTAIAYGTSERALGAAGVDAFEVVTKLPALPIGTEVQSWVRQQVQCSLKTLGIDRLHGLLLHHPDDLLGPQGQSLLASLRAIRDAGLTSGIGVSVYEPEQLMRLAPYMPFDLVQLPFNVLDHRMSESGWLDRLADSGTIVHARSAFLQGLLLMAPENRPERFGRWQAIWDGWDAYLRDAGCSALDACLGHAIFEPRIARIVVGVDSLNHLERTLDAAESATPVAVPANVRSDDPDLLDPGRWLV